MKEQIEAMPQYLNFKKLPKQLLVLSVLFCGLLRVHQAQEKPEYTIYLIGDAGAASLKDSMLNGLYGELLSEEENSSIVFLGDNIYPLGLSGENSETRKEEEEFLNVQLGRLKDYKGRSFVIPGNHDYARGSKYGYERILNQAQYVDSLVGDSTFTPYSGCPDPTEIHLSDDITLVVLDTQWLLYGFQEHTALRGCECNSNNDVFVRLQDIITRNYNKQVMVVGHHPVYTYGNHGGRFTFKDHVFPLAAQVKWAYLPLPIIGSLYPLSRQMGVNAQDVNHPVNSKMRKAFEDVFKQHPNLIYGSGHEHSLQYIAKDSIHYIVSGSGSKITHVEKGEYAEFVAKQKGYSKISYYKGGKVVMSFSDGQDVLFEKVLQEVSEEAVLGAVETKRFPDSVTVVGNGDYLATKSKEVWFGENYREEWGAPIKVPVFDVTKQFGGLKIIKKGGGMATLSLRLEDSTGRQYTLRTVDKNTDKAVPEELRQTIARDVVQDQTSASHPYGAVAVPKMADAIGVYHANPTIVYVPEDPNFGVYQNQVANTLFLFEERPVKSKNPIASYGGTKKVYSTPKVIEKLKEDNDNRVDYKFIVRSRLFDMVLGDWDRHDDQWRWAVFKDGKGKMFRPIPRDRDQVFFLNQGFLPKVTSRRWILPKFEGFNEDIRWEEGFNFNARYFDRYFLVQASEADWLEEARYIQEHLTDEAIEAGVRDLPDTIFSIGGQEIIRILKIRRDKLHEFAKKHYQVLAKNVNVLGSDKTELFEIDRMEGGQTLVRITKVGKSGKLRQVTYERVFNKKETNEIRLYGFGGEDKFTIRGKEKSPIKIRVIAGEGTDEISDVSEKTVKKNVLVYDVKDSVNVPKGNSIKLKLSKKLTVNNYDRASYKYNTLFPLVYAGYTPDDGVLVGGGFIKTTYAFRKSPYATRQQFILGVSAKTGAFKLKYNAQVTKAVGKLDFYFDVDLQSPRNSNFYGFGNESAKDDEQKLKYYRFNYSDFKIDPMLLLNINDRQKLKFGLGYRQTNVDEDKFVSGGYISDSNWADFLEDPHGQQNYVGVQVSYEYDSRDNALIPKNGAYFSLGGSLLNRLNEEFANYSNINSELSLFKTVQFPRDLTFGVRFGGATNIGDFHYLMANKIGGKSSLRGFRRDRFYGRSSLYNTVELRYDLYNVKTIVFPFTIGLIGFHDVGRVWVKAEDSDVWHQSIGGGFYVTPADAMALSLQFAKSSEIFAIYVDLGFSF